MKKINLDSIASVEFSFIEKGAIIAATMASPDEMVLLVSNGQVFRYRFSSNVAEHAFSIPDDIQYPDGGFDLNDKCSIYALDSVIVVVNDFKQHGYLHYPDIQYCMHLGRGDYHADISCFPIALFKDEQGTPHLICGVDWNQVHITNLNTGRILTSYKSLVSEEDERRSVLFEEIYKSGSSFWPRQYDYFYGRLHLSPDRKHFLSAGWGWGSCDDYTVYEIKDFIENSRIRSMNAGGGNHINRGVCWTDAETVAAIGDFYPDQDETHLSEIHFYKINNDKIYGKLKIKEINIYDCEIFFDSHTNVFFAYSDQGGLAALSMEGNVLYQDAEMRIHAFHPDSGLFLSISGLTVYAFKPAIRE